MKPNVRIGPKHPKLAAAGFRFARWQAAKTMGAAGFHQLGSEFADARIGALREKLTRGETVLLAGLGAPGTHNSGLALVEVTQARPVAVWGGLDAAHPAGAGHRVDDANRTMRRADIDRHVVDHDPRAVLLVAEL